MSGVSIYARTGKVPVIVAPVIPPPSAEQLAADARAKRDRLLSATDWTQIPDAPLTADQKAAYAAYRQALRDVPQQAGFPGVIEWPVVP